STFKIHGRFVNWAKSFTINIELLETIKPKSLVKFLWEITWDPNVLPLSRFRSNNGERGDLGAFRFKLEVFAKPWITLKLLYVAAIDFNMLDSKVTLYELDGTTGTVRMRSIEMTFWL